MARTNGFHELWVVGPHKSFQYEASMCGPYPLFINGGTCTITDTPHFVVLALNSTRGPAEAIHNNFHRLENVMPNTYAAYKSYGWKYEWSYRWQRDQKTYYHSPQEFQNLFQTDFNLWEQFTVLDAAINTNGNTVGHSMSGVGDCHFPANALPVPGSETEYDYDNPRPGYSSYRYFRRPILPLGPDDIPDPRLGPTSANVKSTTWRTEMRYNPNRTDYHRSYMNWAFASLPHGPGMHRNVTAKRIPGQTPDYVLNNWWGYLIDHDNFLEPIRALRRAGQTTNFFAEPAWNHSVADFMRFKWDSVGISSQMFSITASVSGTGGVVSGTGKFVYGMTAMLTGTPKPHYWKFDDGSTSVSHPLFIMVNGNRHVTAMYDQAPIVDITSPAADIDVEPDVTSITISGTNNAEVIGSMRWNSSSGSSGSFAATSHWEISNIPISFGDNLISVYGSNLIVELSDSVTVTRKINRVYVTKDGADFNNGYDWESAKATIQGAASAAPAGGTIMVGTGVWYGMGNVNLDWNLYADRSIIGVDPTATVFRLSGDEVFIDNLDGQTKNPFFANFKVEHTGFKVDSFNQGVFTFGEGGNNMSVRLSNLWIKGVYDGDLANDINGTPDKRNGTAIYLRSYGTGDKYYNGTLHISNCLFERWGRVLAYNDYQDSSGTNTVIFERCTLVNCADTQVGSQDASTVWMRGSGTARKIVFDQCVISYLNCDTSCAADTFALYVSDSANQIICRSNITWYCGANTSHDRYYGPGTDRYSGEETDLHFAPDFVDILGKPYSLWLEEFDDLARGWHTAIPEPGSAGALLGIFTISLSLREYLKLWLAAAC